MAIFGAVATQNPKGTRDFLPKDERVQQYIFSKWRETCLAFGYEPYEGPTFEHLELYTEKSGEEIVDQLYAFQDKSGRAIALRPEMTPTLARIVAAQGQSLPKPVKWFSMPRLFRYERAQKGRLREFFQLNMDILGSESLDAEVDLLLAICALMRNFGFKPTDFRVGISNRRLLNALLEQLGVENRDAVYAALDRRAKIGEEAFGELLAEAGMAPEARKALNDAMGCATLDELAPHCTSEAAKAALEELRYLLDRMASLGHGESVGLDLNIVRGLAYYTGLVFEVFDAAKSMRAIAGGGRYDDLCAKLGGERTTGVGFGMGDVVLKDLLEERGLLPDVSRDRLDYWLVSFGNDVEPLFRMAETLRARGRRVGHPLELRKFAKQMQEADRSGAAKVLMLGSDRVPEGCVEVKDLVAGTQSAVPVDRL